MRQLLIRVTEEQAKVLEGKANKSEYLRKALDSYQCAITTDTVEGMRQAFVKTQADIKELLGSVNDLYSVVDNMRGVLIDLVNR